MLRFPFNERKAIEALALIASEWPAITAFYAAKVLFLADKEHLSTYGRPVVGDRYIAMENGPVPSVIFDWFKGNLNLTGDPEALQSAVSFDRSGHYVKMSALRGPDLSYLAQSDIEALSRAIRFCRERSLPELSAVTHGDPSWQEAALNAEMDPIRMIEGENRDELVEVAEEYALHGVP